MSCKLVPAPSHDRYCVISYTKVKIFVNKTLKEPIIMQHLLYFIVYLFIYRSMYFSFSLYVTLLVQHLYVQHLCFLQNLFNFLFR